MELGQLAKILEAFSQLSAGSSASVPLDECLGYRVGDKVLIRTVTYHYIGEISRITPDAVVLDGACWLANSGRFADALRTGKVEEVEVPGKGCSVARASMVDMWAWSHPLPTETA